MKREDRLFIAKVFANKKFFSGITRDYKLMLNIYAVNKEEAEQKIKEHIESQSVQFEVTHTLISCELSEEIAQRSEKV
jgi:hypothetical protein